MIVGAYPTAVFETIQGKRNVPFRNIIEPFALGTKFGDELEKYYLKPLGIKRENCWITNLLKVFLFKPGHVNSYKALGSSYLPPTLHSQFEELACFDANLTMFEQELKLASPKLIITLGADVAGILHPEIPKNNRNNLLNGDLSQFTIKSRTYNSIHFAHPGIIMRRQQKNNLWCVIHLDYPKLIVQIQRDQST